ncbi:MAG: hypothetical protein ABIH89_08270 [Elusimicrobiota bacterium]
MRKLYVTTGIIALVFTVLGTGYAANSSVFNMASDGHFMKMDARDAYNRPVECEYSFETTPFLRAYSRLTPFGVCRLQRFPLDNSLKITIPRIFTLPVVAVSFFYGARRLLSYFSEHIVSKAKVSRIGIHLLIILLVLILEPFLQTGSEPRFRIPVLIE